MRARIVLEPGESVEVVVDGCTVNVASESDGDGDVFVELSGVDCDLEGVMPGNYYPRPHGAEEASCSDR